MDLSNYEIKLRKSFQFFRVSDIYVEYLKSIDKNVCDNYSEGRTHIGIIIEMYSKLYVAPLTSEGKEYLLNNKKYKRIVHSIENGNLGFIRVGNMIPVPASELHPIIISELDDTKYKSLLLDQYLYLKKEKNTESIRKMANKLYSKRYNNDNYFLSDIMCNFRELEVACEDWENSH